MDDLQEYKLEAEAQFERARSYGDLNPEYWICIYRALRRENSLWVNLGRVPEEKRTVNPDITQKLTAALENVPERSYTASTDSGTTRTSATPIDSDSNMPKRVRRKAPRRDPRSREESPRIRMSRYIAAQDAQGSKSGVINQPEPFAAEKSINLSPFSEQKMVENSTRQRSEPSKPSKILILKVKRQRKRSAGGSTEDAVQHHPTSRSQSSATMLEALATNK